MHSMQTLNQNKHQTRGVVTQLFTNLLIFRIPSNMRPWVYCAGLRAGDATDFDFFWNKYLNEDLAGEQVVLLQAAGCTSDTASLGRFWEAITAGENDVIIRAQDLSVALSSAITSNEDNTMKSFRWLQVPANLIRTRDT